MVRIKFIISLLFFSTPSFAEEMWACNGWIFGDSSKDDHPFLLKGNKQRYSWTDKYSHPLKMEVKYVAENKADYYKYLIYVSDTSSTNKTAYYFHFTNNNELIIRNFSWDSIAQTKCTKQ